MPEWSYCFDLIVCCPSGSTNSQISTHSSGPFVCRCCCSCMASRANYRLPWLGCQCLLPIFLLFVVHTHTRTCLLAKYPNIVCVELLEWCRTAVRSVGYWYYLWQKINITINCRQFSKRYIFISNRVNSNNSNANNMVSNTALSANANNNSNNNNDTNSTTNLNVSHQSVKILDFQVCLARKKLERRRKKKRQK